MDSPPAFNDSDQINRWKLIGKNDGVIDAHFEFKINSELKLVGLVWNYLKK